jgi:hypothetical protein
MAEDKVLSRRIRETISRVVESRQRSTAARKRAGELAANTERILTALRETQERWKRSGSETEDRLGKTTLARSRG